MGRVDIRGREVQRCARIHLQVGQGLLVGVQVVEQHEPHGGHTSGEVHFLLRQQVTHTLTIHASAGQNQLGAWSPSSRGQPNAQVGGSARTTYNTYQAVQWNFPQRQRRTVQDASVGLQHQKQRTHTNTCKTKPNTSVFQELFGRGKHHGSSPRVTKSCDTTQRGTDEVSHAPGPTHWRGRVAPQAARCPWRGRSGRQAGQRLHIGNEDITVHRTQNSDMGRGECAQATPLSASYRRHG